MEEEKTFFTIVHKSLFIASWLNDWQEKLLGWNWLVFAKSKSPKAERRTYVPYTVEFVIGSNVSKNGHFLNVQSYAYVIYEWFLRLIYIPSWNCTSGGIWCQVVVVEFVQVGEFDDNSY